MNLLRSRHIALLAVAIAACGSDASRSIDPTATYTVYGERFEPGVAVPAPAVFAELSAYVGRELVVEGVASGICEDPACVTAITSGVGGKILVFLHSEQGDAHRLPADISGRRIVASGTLDGGRGSSHALTEAALLPSTRGISAPSTGDTFAQSTREPPVPSTSDRSASATADTLRTGADSTFRFYATGLMVERVRP